MTAFFVLGLALLGLILGSFLSALTYRLPRGKSIFWGRSYCPKCKKKLAWYDNIPLFSFLLLKGRCRQCGQKISWRYPAIELTTSLGFVGAGFLAPNLATLAIFLILFILLLTIFIIDLEEKTIPDELVFLGFGVVGFYLLLTSPPILFVNLASGFGAASFLLVLHLATRGRGMGLGDVKLAVLGGTFLGWPLMLVSLFLAFLTGAVVGIILVLAGRAKFGKEIPFGPFLIVGFLSAFLLGNKILNLFLG